MEGGSVPMAAPKVAPLAVNKEDLGFLIAFGVNAGLALFFMALFCFLRPRFPDFYFPKAQVLRWRSNIPNSYFGWIPHMISRFSMSSVLREHGLDVYMYFRFIRASLLILLVLFFFSLITLIPTNATGNNVVMRNVTETINGVNVTMWRNETLKGLERITLTNIPSSSNLLWVHFFFTIFTTVLVCWVLFKDFREYESLRTKLKEAKTIENKTVLLNHIQGTNEQEVREFLISVLPNKNIDSIENINVVRDVENLKHLQEKYEKNAKKLERVQFQLSEKPEEIIYHKPKDLSHPFGDSSRKMEALTYYEQKTAELLRQIQELQNRFQSLRPKNAAFVSFNCKEWAQILAQSSLSTNSGLVPQAFEAPEPRAVLWKFVGIDSLEFFLRTRILHIGIFIMSLLWIIPISFFSSFTNIENLDKVVPKLVEVLEKNQALYGFIAGLLPVLLTIIFLALVPTIIRAAAMQAGFHSLTSVDRAVINKFFAFLFINVLLGFLVGPVAIDLAKNAADLTLNRILNIVASTVPRQSNSMTIYVMTTSFAAFPSELLRLVPLLLRAVKHKFLAKTIREHNEVNHNAIGYFAFSIRYPKELLIFAIVLTYSTMSPFILLFGVVYFAMAYFSAMYNLQFVYPTEYKNGGMLWTCSFELMIFSLCFYQLIMASILLAKNFWVGTIILLLIPITIYVRLMIHRIYSKNSTFGVLQTIPNSSTSTSLESLAERTALLVFEQNSQNESTRAYKHKEEDWNPVEFSQGNLVEPRIVNQVEESYSSLP